MSSSWYAMQHQRLQSSPAVLKENDSDDKEAAAAEASSSWSSHSSFLRRRSNSNGKSKRRQTKQQQGGGKQGRSEGDDAMPSDFDFLGDGGKEEEQKKKRQQRLEQKKAWRERSAQKKRARDAQWRVKQQQQKRLQQEQGGAHDNADDGSEFDVTDSDADANGTATAKVLDVADDDDSDANDNADIDDGTTEDTKDDKQKKRKDEKEKNSSSSSSSKYEVDILKLAPGEEPPDPSCCRRYLSERNPCYDWYQIKDKLIGKRLDVQATFCPQTRNARIYKTLATTAVITGNIMNMLAYRDLYGSLDLGFFVYLDNVGMVAASGYMLLSMLNSILGAKQPWDKVEGRMRWVWMAFIVASHTLVLMSIMFWAFMFDGNLSNLSFLTCMKYGGIAAQVIFDGMSINRIPLLWMNWWGMLWLINLFYFFFFAPLYSFFFSSNLAIPGASTALYPWLDWRGDWEFTLVASVVVVFALSPAVFLILWLMSLYSWPSCLCCQKESRRYLLSDAQRRKLKAAKLEAHRKKKEKDALQSEELALFKAQQSEELALLKKDPMALLPDKTGGGGGSDNNASIGNFFNLNRRSRRDIHDDDTVMSMGSSSMGLQPGEQSTTRCQDDVDEESQHGSLHQETQEEKQEQKEQQQQYEEEFQDDDSAKAGYNNKGHEQEQEQGQFSRSGAWGRLGSLRSFLGNSFTNRNNNMTGNNIHSDGASNNDADSSFSSMTESHYCYRTAIANGDDPCGVEDVALDESRYPWNDVMGGLATDNKMSNANRHPVVGNLSMLDNNNNRYKYPWDHDGSQGSLTYL